MMSLIIGMLIPIAIGMGVITCEADFHQLSPDEQTYYKEIIVDDVVIGG